MSAQETTKIDDAVVASWNSHDLEKFIALLADNVVWYDLGSPEPFKGKDAARVYMQSWLTAFPDFTMRPKNRLVTDDQVAVELEFSGTNKGPLQGPPGTPPIPATGKKVTASKGAYFARVSGGKVVEIHTYPDNPGMMMQLGLMPAPGE